MLNHPRILLLELPALPKGCIPLGLSLVAQGFKSVCATVDFLDLNIDKTDLKALSSIAAGYDLVGFRVSAQNYEIAAELSQAIQAYAASAKSLAPLTASLPVPAILWGGELPSLLPELALEHADAIVERSFEGLAPEIIHDLSHGRLKSRYAQAKAPLAKFISPDFSSLSLNRYSRLLGLPLETSRGCNRHCSFCTVHSMQPSIRYKPMATLSRELDSARGEFVYVVDYNLGLESQHLNQLCDAFSRAELLGWSAEMCLEQLEDCDLVERLARAGCKIIYCGLETLEQESLKLLAKTKTNTVARYQRIIQQVQQAGIELGVGLILGLENTNQKTFSQTCDFLESAGVLYAKLTYLTFNPGTKAKSAMQRKGHFLSENVADFDGIRCTFLPHGVEESDVYNYTTEFIKRFYSRSSAIMRSRHLASDRKKRLGFIAYSQLYGSFYHQLLKRDLIGSISCPKRRKNFAAFLSEEYVKSRSEHLAEDSVRQWWLSSSNVPRSKAEVHEPIEHASLR